MKRKRETAPGGFWSKLTSFFTSTPEEDKEVPSPKKNNEQSHSRLSDHDEEPRALDQSKRRRVANTEELPPTPQTPLDHIREAVRNGVTKEDFQYYTRILQDALIENENVATNFPQRPTPIHPKSTSPANIIRAFSGQRASTVPIGSYTPHPSFASQPLQRGVRSPLFDSSARDFARQQPARQPSSARKSTSGPSPRISSQERPKRTPVRRRPIDAMQDQEFLSPSAATSITAKKILDTLNEFSSPLVDEVRRSAGSKQHRSSAKDKVQRRLTRQLQEEEDNVVEVPPPTESLHSRKVAPSKVELSNKRKRIREETVDGEDYSSKQSAQERDFEFKPQKKAAAKAPKGKSITNGSARNNKLSFQKEDEEHSPEEDYSAAHKKRKLHEPTEPNAEVDSDIQADSDLPETIEDNEDQDISTTQTETKDAATVSKSLLADQKQPASFGFFAALGAPKVETDKAVKAATIEIPTKANQSASEVKSKTTDLFSSIKPFAGGSTDKPKDLGSPISSNFPLQDKPKESNLFGSQSTKPDASASPFSATVTGFNSSLFAQKTDADVGFSVPTVESQTKVSAPSVKENQEEAKKFSSADLTSFIFKTPLQKTTPETDGNAGKGSEQTEPKPAVEISAKDASKSPFAMPTFGASPLTGGFAAFLSNSTPALDSTKKADKEESSTAKDSSVSEASPSADKPSPSTSPSLAASSSFLSSLSSPSTQSAQSSSSSSSSLSTSSSSTSASLSVSSPFTVPTAGNLPGAAFSLFATSSKPVGDSNATEDTKPAISTDFLKIKPLASVGDTKVTAAPSFSAFGQPSFGAGKEETKASKEDASDDKAPTKIEEPNKEKRVKEELTSPDFTKKPETASTPSWSASGITIGDWNPKTTFNFGTKPDSPKADSKAGQDSKPTVAPLPTLDIEKPATKAPGGFAYNFGSGAVTDVDSSAMDSADNSMADQSILGGAAPSASFSFGGQTPSGSFMFGSGATEAVSSFPATTPSAFTPTQITPPAPLTAPSGMFVFGESSSSVGAPSGGSATSIFGSTPAAAAAPSPFFGTAPSTPSPSPFGVSSNPTPFAPSQSTFPPAASSVFGSSGMSNPSDPFSSFGAPATPAAPAFGAPSVFGSSGGSFPVFGGSSASSAMGSTGFDAQSASPFATPFSAPQTSQAPAFGGGGGPFGAQPPAAGGGGFALGVADNKQAGGRRMVRAARRGRGK